MNMLLELTMLPTSHVNQGHAMKRCRDLYAISLIWFWCLWKPFIKWHRLMQERFFYIRHSITFKNPISLYLKIPFIHLKKRETYSNVFLYRGCMPLKQPICFILNKIIVSYFFHTRTRARTTLSPRSSHNLELAATVRQATLTIPKRRRETLIAGETSLKRSPGC